MSSAAPPSWAQVNTCRPERKSFNGKNLRAGLTKPRPHLLIKETKRSWLEPKPRAASPGLVFWRTSWGEKNQWVKPSPVTRAPCDYLQSTDYWLPLSWSLRGPNMFKVTCYKHKLHRFKLNFIYHTLAKCVRLLWVSWSSASEFFYIKHVEKFLKIIPLELIKKSPPSPFYSESFPKFESVSHLFSC